MFGLGKKSQSTPHDDAATTLRLSVMPDVFYGGKDPVVRYEKEEVVVKPSTIISAPATKAVVASQASVSALPEQKKRPIALMIGGVLVFLVGVGGITWYYLNQAGYFKATPTPPTVSAPVVTEPVTEPDVTDVPVVTPTSAVDVTTTTLTTPPSLSAVPLDFPLSFAADSSDADADSVTDIEEELLGLDGSVYDTDGDGYYDGLEIENLYNPHGTAPMLLIDSGLVREYINPTWRYRVYYPTGWEPAAVDTNADQVLFSSIGGDYIDIYASQKQQQETFADWFGRVAVGQSFSNLVAGTNRFRITTYVRGDTMVAYIDTPNVVYVMIYHPLSQTSAAYRQMMKMMIASFRPGAVDEQLPPQPLLAPPPTVSSTEPVAP